MHWNKTGWGWLWHQHGWTCKFEHPNGYFRRRFRCVSIISKSQKWFFGKKNLLKIGNDFYAPSILYRVTGSVLFPEGFDSLEPLGATPRCDSHLKGQSSMHTQLPLQLPGLADLDMHELQEVLLWSVMGHGGILLGIFVQHDHLFTADG